MTRPVLRLKQPRRGPLVLRSQITSRGKRALATLAAAGGGPIALEAMPSGCGFQTLKVLSDRGLVRISVEITAAGRDRLGG